MTSSWQNFSVDVLEAQISAPSTTTLWRPLFDQLNLAFTLFFTAELIVNVCAHWFQDFVNNWSVARSFDQFAPISFFPISFSLPARKVELARRGPHCPQPGSPRARYYERHGGPAHPSAQGEDCFIPLCSRNSRQSERNHASA